MIATLGGPGTFAGQATQLLAADHPEFGGISYLPTMDEVWAAMSAGTVDSGVLTSETTNFGLDDIADRLLGINDDLYVNAEILVPYHCMLLGKPGADPAAISLILGHGSLVHCRRYLGEHFPGVEVRMHEKNSLAAAAEVLASDGHVAVVGTAANASKNGLTVLEREVDDGAVGAWWLMSRKLQVSDKPDVVLVAVEHPAEDATTDLLSHARERGLRLRSLATRSECTLFGQSLLVAFSVPSGSTPRSPEALCEGIAGCRFVGAFPSTAADPMTDSG